MLQDPLHTSLSLIKIFHKHMEAPTIHKQQLQKLEYKNPRSMYQIHA
jgi:hypothetical protein